jgi:transcription elongation factor Elf1
MYRFSCPRCQRECKSNSIADEWVLLNCPKCYMFFKVLVTSVLS